MAGYTAIYGYAYCVGVLRDMGGRPRVNVGASPSDHKVDTMSCHICRRTGQRTCDPAEAEIKCMICGQCQNAPLTPSGSNDVVCGRDGDDRVARKEVYK
jgi:hypothetical protein